MDADKTYIIMLWRCLQIFNYNEATEIREIAKRTLLRIKEKEKYDSMIDLKSKKPDESVYYFSAKSSNENVVRLLDEGMIVDAMGNPDVYIKRGTIQSFYDNLPDDYIGTVNIGHKEYATDPFPVGIWTKKDLYVVDIGDNRKALDVNLNLDYESRDIKELQRTDVPVGVSVKMSYSIDGKSSEEYGIPVIDSINVIDYAIVGEAGNVRSSNVKLNGGKEVAKTKENSFFENLFGKTVDTKQEKKELNVSDDKGTKENELDAAADEMIKNIKELAAESEEKDEKIKELEAKVKELEAENKSNEQKIDKFITRLECACKNTAERYHKEMSDFGENINKENKIPAYAEQSADGIGDL